MSMIFISSDREYATSYWRLIVTLPLLFTIEKMHIFYPPPFNPEFEKVFYII